MRLGQARGAVARQNRSAELRREQQAARRLRSTPCEA
jgi:hypothetical protein